MIAVLVVPSDRIYELPVTLTAADVARVIDRSVSWIEKQVRAGTFKIPRVEHAPGLLWTREAVQAYLAKQTTQSPSVVELRQRAEATANPSRQRRAS